MCMTLIGAKRLKKKKKEHHFPEGIAQSLNVDNGDKRTTAEDKKKG